jgi:hypothetical protein
LSENSGPSWSFGLRIFPLVTVMAYLTLTIGLFLWGPLTWPVTNLGTLLIFLASALIGISVCYVAGVTFGTAKESGLTRWRTVLVVGAISSCALLVPSAYFYAGMMPWNILDALRDQNATYQAFQHKLVETAGARTVIAIARAFAFPFIFAVLPLGILHWRSMTPKLWVLLLATLLSSIIFSILRGTDREIFDILFVAIASTMVLIARWCVSDGITLKKLVMRRSVIAGTLVFLVVIGVTLKVFVDRRIQRLGYTPQAFANGAVDAPSLAEHLAKSPNAWLDVMCVKIVIDDKHHIPVACMDRDHLLVRSGNVTLQYAAMALSSYLTQGYYGLSLAMKQDFHSTLGIGHSTALVRTYERLTDDKSLYQRSYTFGLRNMHWSDDSQWQTIFPWLANDVGFPGAIFAISLFAFLWGQAWRDAVRARNDGAAIVFCLLFQMFVYIPANNQMTQIFDPYFAVVGWTAFWLIRRQKYPLGTRSSLAT